MNQIIFVRHAQSEFNAGQTDRPDSEVTPKGLIAAKQTGLYIKELIHETGTIHGWRGFTSHYHRCLRTARSIGAFTGLPFQVRTEIGESPEANRPYLIIHRGCMFAEFDWKLVEQDEMGAIDCSEETDADYLSRLDAFIADLPEKCVIVSHMVPIKDMIKRICGDDAPLFFDVDVASVSHIKDGKPSFINMPA